MSTLYAFINPEQFKRWSVTAEQPCVEQFLREVGTTEIKFSREGVSQPFVPIKPGGCVRLRVTYPVNDSNAVVKIVSKPKETMFMRMKRYFSFE
jgi:hypothetical protein